MSGVRGMVEAVGFLAVAAALHMLWFYLQPEDTGALAGGSGGGSSVTLTAAKTDLAALVDSWDNAPDAAREPDIIEETDAPPPPIAPDTASEATKMIPPAVSPRSPAPLSNTPAIENEPNPTKALASAPDLNAPQAMDAPALDTAMASPSALAIPRLLTAPETIQAPQIPQENPPLSDETPPMIDRSELTGPVEENIHAPKAAPAPRTKPKPPARLRPVPTAQAQAKPEPSEAPKQQRQLGRQTAAKTQPAAASKDGDAKTTTVAAGVGSQSEAGAGDSSAKVAGAELRSNLAKAWGDAIRRGVEQKKEYPRIAKRSGKVIVSITVTRAGGLYDARVRETSGSGRLDKAALQAVRAAAPYNAAPHELVGDRFHFLLPVIFKR